jgi:hypothetical protein
VNELNQPKEINNSVNKETSKYKTEENEFENILNEINKSDKSDEKTNVTHNNDKSIADDKINAQNDINNNENNKTKGF